MARKYQHDENLILPADLDYSKIRGISTEERHALERVRPVNIGMARRIEGVTPAGALQLVFHLKKFGGKKGLVGRDAESVPDEILGAAP